MTYRELDLIFPYFIFFYGALITFVLNAPPLVKLAEEKLPPQMNQQLNAHRGLALACLVLGSLWSLQNLWLVA